MDDLHLLGVFVQADQAAGEPQTFVMTYPGGTQNRVWVGVRGWRDDIKVPSEHKMDDLADRGWLRIVDSRGKTRQVAVTSRGREAWAAHAAQTARDARPVDLRWDAVRGTLRQVYEMYESQGAPAMGAWIGSLFDDPVTAHQAEGHIEALVRGGYLEVGRNSAAGPTNVRPTETTFQMFAGWPSDAAQEALDGLVRELDTAIERTPDEDRRSKLTALRGGLVGAGRDVLIAYFEKKVMGL